MKTTRFKWLGALTAALLISAPAGRVFGGETQKEIRPVSGESGGKEAQRVGELCDVRCITFEGAKTFPDDVLRLGLQVTPDFLEISHPLALLADYLAAIESRMRIGYLHNGFPQAKISVRYDPQAARIVVRVEEGPRYVCGDVIVTGTRKMSVKPIIECLATPRVNTQSVQSSFNFITNASSMKPLDQPGLDEAAIKASLWITNQPAHFSEFAQTVNAKQVTNAFRAAGFFFPRFQVRAVPRQDRQVADLLVEVQDEGPRAVIGNIEFIGNKKNSRKALMRYLDLKPGMALTGELVPRIEQRFWEAARFLTNHVNIGPPDKRGRVPLKIELVEYDPAPSLDQDFSRAQKAQLRVRDYFARLGSTGDDLVFTLRGVPEFPYPMEFYLSPGVGVMWIMTAAPGQKSPPPVHAIILQTDLVGIYSSTRPLKLALPDFDAQLTTFISVTPIPNEEDNHFNLGVGAGFSSNEAESNAPPFRMELTFAPVAFFDFLGKFGFDCRFDGSTLLASNRSQICSIDEKTGRLSASGTATNGTAAYKLSFERGAYLRALQELQNETDDIPNAYSTNAPLSSSLAFVAGELARNEFIQSRFFSNAPATIARGSALMEKLSAKNVFSPLNQLWDNTTHKDKEGFLIPTLLESMDAANSGLLALGAEWFVFHSGQLFPTGSWAWTLSREAGRAFTGKTQYTEEALQGIYDSERTGPLGCLVAAKLLTQVHSPMAEKFAASGLDRLSAAAFRQDCEVFLSGDALIGQCAARAAQALGEMNPEEIETFGALQSAALNEFLLQCARLMREAKDQPVAEAIAPALDAYWERELKGQVTSALKQLATSPEAAFMEGMKFYQGQGAQQDYAAAAQWFQRAAEQSHPGGEFMLAVAYEKGEGVAQDFTEALKWYQAAAAHGHGDAAMSLGNLYNDGINVAQDRVQACIWFSVAAARGNKVAEFFRKSVDQKLTPEQRAEVKKQVAAIQASWPPEKAPAK